MVEKRYKSQWWHCKELGTGIIQSFDGSIQWAMTKSISKGIEVYWKDVGIWIFLSLNDDCIKGGSKRAIDYFEKLYYCVENQSKMLIIVKGIINQESLKQDILGSMYDEMGSQYWSIRFIRM